LGHYWLDFMTQKPTESKHGTLCLIDGVTKSTWTVQFGNSKKTFDGHISEETFRRLWDGISDIAELDGFRVRSSDVRLDFTKNYVIGIAYTLSGQQGRATFLIPHNSNSEAAIMWAHEIESLSGQ
jgi:hypothetical protein